MLQMLEPIGRDGTVKSRGVKDDIDPGQLLRDATVALEKSKQMLALAIGSRATEERELLSLAKRIAEVEECAVSSLQAGDLERAARAAEIIAALQQDLAVRRKAMAKRDADIAHARPLVEQGRCRLNALRRCLEMARVHKALQRAGANGSRASISCSDALREADATLERIRRRQAGDVALEGVFVEAPVASGNRPGSAEDVLARIKAKAAARSASPEPS